MSTQETVLIVENSEFYRKRLIEILSDEYGVIEAENGEEALLQLERHGSGTITAIILDLVMPKINGFEFLEQISKMEAFKHTPVIVSTENSDAEEEACALRLGAWDFIFKPYHTDVLRFRLRNAILRSQLPVFQQLKSLAEYDALTGLHNKTKFFSRTREMIDENPECPFVFIRFDVNRFQLINSFFGVEEGDRLLCYLAREFRRILERYKHCAYGRIEADVFACCIEYRSRDCVLKALERVKAFVRLYNLSFDIVPTFGVYYLDDLTLPVNVMLDRATLAAKTRKGSYIDIIGEYVPEMSLRIAEEQQIVNEMVNALEHDQFVVYIQPKYSLLHNNMTGGEALVRWQHPDKGMIAPNVFIPVFERNGFISKLDYYVWEKVCHLLRTWIDAGITPQPISVNVSRVNLYNPQIVESICGLIEKYQLPARLLELELTESAYTDNPLIMRQVVHRLREKGFAVLMDDFGTGYSSLSILKDIEVDILKIDLHFLEDSANPGRGENIIASIIRMAKWLNIPTIAEGVEKPEQVEFLKSISCEYAQGFIFARPMPTEQYEALARETREMEQLHGEVFDWDTLWETNSMVDPFFSDASQATCLYEVEGDVIEVLRANRTFKTLFQFASDRRVGVPWDTQDSDKLRAAFRTCIALKSVTECRYRMATQTGEVLLITLRLQYLNCIGNKHILLGHVSNRAVQGEKSNHAQQLELLSPPLSLLRECVILMGSSAEETDAMRSALGDQFHVLQVESVRECLLLLLEDTHDVALILLGESLASKLVDELLGHLARDRYAQRMQHVFTMKMVSPADVKEEVLLLERGVGELIRSPFSPELLRLRVRNLLDAGAYRKER